MKDRRGAAELPDFFTIHQLTQPVIHIAEDGDRAKAPLRLFQCGGNSDGSSGPWIGGIWENTAVKEMANENSACRTCATLLALPAVTAGPEPAHRPAVAPRRAGHKPLATPPEAEYNKAPGGCSLAKPIRSKQYSFPEIVGPAFHYKNLVTSRMPADLLPRVAL